MEAAIPERALLFQPVFGEIQTARFQLISSDAARFLRTHQTAIFQHIEVLHE